MKGLDRCFITSGGKLIVREIRGITVEELCLEGMFCFMFLSDTRGEVTTFWEGLFGSESSGEILGP